MATQIYEGRSETTADGRQTIIEQREVITPAPSSYAGYRVLYFLLDILELLLALRLLLELLAANPATEFVFWLYQITAPLIAPFRGAFAPTVTQGTVIDWSTILAMVMYALGVYVIVKLINLIAK